MPDSFPPPPSRTLSKKPTPPTSTNDNAALKKTAEQLIAEMQAVIRGQQDLVRQMRVGGGSAATSRGYSPYWGGSRSPQTPDEEAAFTAQRIHQGVQTGRQFARSAVTAGMNFFGAPHSYGRLRGDFQHAMGGQSQVYAEQLRGIGTVRDMSPAFGDLGRQLGFVGDEARQATERMRGLVSLYGVSNREMLQYGQTLERTQRYSANPATAATQMTRDVGNIATLQQSYGIDTQTSTAIGRMGVSIERFASIVGVNSQSVNRGSLGDISQQAYGLISQDGGSIMGRPRQFASTVQYLSGIEAANPDSPQARDAAASVTGQFAQQSHTRNTLANAESVLYYRSQAGGNMGYGEAQRAAQSQSGQMGLLIGARQARLTATSSAEQWELFAQMHGVNAEDARAALNFEDGKTVDEKIAEQQEADAKAQKRQRLNGLLGPGVAPNAASTAALDQIQGGKNDSLAAYAHDRGITGNLGLGDKNLSPQEAITRVRDAAIAQGKVSDAAAFGRDFNDHNLRDPTLAPKGDQVRANESGIENAAYQNASKLIDDMNRAMSGEIDTLKKLDGAILDTVKNLAMFTDRLGPAGALVEGAIGGIMGIVGSGTVLGTGGGGMLSTLLGMGGGGGAAAAGGGAAAAGGGAAAAGTAATVGGVAGAAATYAVASSAVDTWGQNREYQKKLEEMRKQAASANSVEEIDRQIAAREKQIRDNAEGNRHFGPLPNAVVAGKPLLPNGETDAQAAAARTSMEELRKKREQLAAAQPPASPTAKDTGLNGLARDPDHPERKDAKPPSGGGGGSAGSDAGLSLSEVLRQGFNRDDGGVLASMRDAVREVRDRLLGISDTSVLYVRTRGAGSEQQTAAQAQAYSLAAMGMYAYPDGRPAGPYQMGGSSGGGSSTFSGGAYSDRTGGGSPDASGPTSGLDGTSSPAVGASGPPAVTTYAGGAIPGGTGSNTGVPSHSGTQPAQGFQMNRFTPMSYDQYRDFIVSKGGGANNPILAENEYRDFMARAQKFNLDPRFLLTKAQYETHFGNDPNAVTALRDHNLSGLTYASADDGLLGDLGSQVGGGRPANEGGNYRRFNTFGDYWEAVGRKLTAPGYKEYTDAGDVYGVNYRWIGTGAAGAAGSTERERAYNASTRDYGDPRGGTGVTATENAATAPAPAAAQTGDATTAGEGAGEPGKGIPNGIGARVVARAKENLGKLAEMNGLCETYVEQVYEQITGTREKFANPNARIDAARRGDPKAGRILKDGEARRPGDLVMIDGRVNRGYDPVGHIGIVGEDTSTYYNTTGRGIQNGKIPTQGAVVVRMPEEESDAPPAKLPASPAAASSPTQPPATPSAPTSPTAPATTPVLARVEDGLMRLLTFAASINAQNPQSPLTNGVIQGARRYETDAAALRGQGLGGEELRTLVGIARQPLDDALGGQHNWDVQRRTGLLAPYEGAEAKLDAATKNFERISSEFGKNPGDEERDMVAAAKSHLDQAQREFNHQQMYSQFLANPDAFNQQYAKRDDGSQVTDKDELGRLYEGKYGFRYSPQSIGDAARADDRRQQNAKDAFGDQLLALFGGPEMQRLGAFKQATSTAGMSEEDTFRLVAQAAMRQMGNDRADNVDLLAMGRRIVMGGDPAGAVQTAQAGGFPVQPGGAGAGSPAAAPMPNMGQMGQTAGQQYVDGWNQAVAAGMAQAHGQVQQGIAQMFQVPNTPTPYGYGVPRPTQYPGNFNPAYPMPPAYGPTGSDPGTSAAGSDAPGVYTNDAGVTRGFNDHVPEQFTDAGYTRR